MALPRLDRDRASLVGLVLLVAVGLAIAFPGSGHPVLATVVWLGCLAAVALSNPRGILSFEGLYLLWLGLFHLGLVVPIALGVDAEPFPEWLLGRDVSRALGMFTAGALAFTAGVLVVAPRRAAVVDEAATLPPHGPLFAVGLAVAAIGAAIFWAGVVQAGLLSGAYTDYWERALTGDVRLFAFGFMLLPIGVVVAAVGATPRQMAYLALGYAIVVGPVFVNGFRGPALVHAATLFTVWMRKDSRTAMRVALATAVALFVISPAFRASRSLGTSFAAAASEARPLDGVMEAGGSLRPLLVTLERVEAGDEPLWMGRSYEMALDRVVPNVGSKPRSSDGILTPSSWATMHEDLWAWERGGGVGFSAIAEPFLNFGRAGVVLFFLLLGAALSIGDRALSGNHYRAAIAAATFGFVLWTVRNDAIAVLRAGTFAALVVLAAWMVASVRRRRPV
jgi:hypothetical protein